MSGAIQTPGDCTRPVSTRTGRKGSRRTETVYAITDLEPHQARPDELATWIRGHWQIENGLHWVRDVTFAEDLSRVRIGAGPQVMAALRNLRHPGPRSTSCRATRGDGPGLATATLAADLTAPRALAHPKLLCPCGVVGRVGE
jgi:hypothetical protein